MRNGEPWVMIRVRPETADLVNQLAELLTADMQALTDGCHGWPPAPVAQHAAIHRVIAEALLARSCIVDQTIPRMSPLEKRRAAVRARHAEIEAEYAARMA